MSKLDVEKILNMNLPMDIDYNGKEFTQYSQDRYLLLTMIEAYKDLSEELNRWKNTQPKNMEDYEQSAQRIAELEAENNRLLFQIAKLQTKLANVY